MRKLAIYMFAVLTAATVNASYNGNPAAPELTPGAGLWWSGCDSDWGIKLGYQRDDVSNRKLRSSDGFFGSADRFEIHQDQGVLTLNWCDKYEVYGSLGAGSFELNESPFHFTSRDRWNWGVGARGILWQCDCTTLGLDFNYQRINPHGRHTATTGLGSFSSNWRYSEWQVGLGIAQKIGFFTPYAAVKYSHARVKFTADTDDTTDPTVSFSLRSRKHIGLALGTTLSNCDWFDLTFEARVFDERACTVAANVKF